MNKLVTVHLLLDVDYIDEDEDIEKALWNNLDHNDFVLSYCRADPGEDFFHFEDYDKNFIDNDDLMLTSSQEPDTITLSEVLKKLSELRLYMACLKIYDDGSGRITARTPDNQYNEYLVFKFHNIEELMEELDD